MTAKQIYDAVLTELNKNQAPSITLEDFNHFFNKAINQYVNRRYNIYDVNQQSTDDLRVLKATAVLTPTLAKPYLENESVKDDEEAEALMSSLYGATYEVMLPDDYLHTLNCICVYKVHTQFKCYNKNTFVKFGATRLTSDMWGKIINNFYMQPSYKLPYYYIHNVNIKNNTSTNPIVLDNNGQIISGTDYSKDSQGTSNPTNNFIYHRALLSPTETPDSINNVNDNVWSKTTDLSIKFEIPSSQGLNYFYIFIIPENLTIDTIRSAITDESNLYTNRYYKEEKNIYIDGNKYKVVFLGDGQNRTGEYTIKFN